MSESRLPNAQSSTARNAGVSCAIQLVLQAIVSVLAEATSDADVWRRELASSVKGQVLRSAVEGADAAFMDAMTESANATIDFLIFGHDSDVAN